MERPPTASAFLHWSNSSAENARNLGRAVLEGPREGPDGRQFFVYARPTADNEVLVLVSEARYLLQPVLRSRSPFMRYLLIDPGRSLWVGCVRPEECRAFTSSEWPSIPGLASLMRLVSTPRGRAWSTDEIPAVVGLGSRRSAVAWQTLDHGGRTWVLAVIASAQSIEARERALMWWLLGTGAGLALALTTVGTFIIRHQRRAAALEARLTHAQEFAHLRERTEKLVENVSVGLIAVTTDGRVALTNRFLGERIADLPVGTLLAEALGAGDPEATERIRKTLAEALRSGRPRAVPEREVPLLASKPGHFDLRIIPLKQPAQDVNAMVLVEDLSELKSLEKQLVRAEKLITVGVLTAGLAHEIGTPLGIIRGRAEVLLTRIKDLAVARDLESMVRQIDSDHQLAHCQGRKRQELYALIERVAMVAHAGPHRLHRRDSDAVPAMRLLIEHSWPGNVRELGHLVQSMVVTSTTAEVGEEPLRASLRDVSSERILDRARRGLWSLRELEQEYIAWILEHTRGNKTRASEILGIDPSTLYRREGKAKS